MEFKTALILFLGEVFAAVAVVFAYYPQKHEELGATRINIPVNIETSAA